MGFENTDLDFSFCDQIKPSVVFNVISNIFPILGEYDLHSWEDAFS